MYSGDRALHRLLTCLFMSTFFTLQVSASSLPVLDLANTDIGESWYPNKVVKLDTLEPSEAQKALAQQEEKISSFVLKTGETSSAYWSSISISNSSDSQMTRYFDFVDTYFEKLDVYRQTSNGFEKIYSSGRLTDKSRQEFELWPGFNYQLQAGESAQLFIRYQAVMNMSPRMYIHDRTKHMQWKAKGYLIGIGSAFLLLGMFAYSSLLYLRLKQNIYILFAFFVGVVGTMNSINIGLVDSLFTVGEPFYFFHLIEVFYPLAHVSVFMFGRVFLELEKHDPFSLKVFNFSIYLAVIMCFLALIGVHSQAVQAVFICFSSAFFMNAVYRAIKRGFVPAQLYAIGTGVFAVTAVIWALTVEGVIEANIYTRYAPIFGVCVEAVFISLSVGYMLRRADLLQMEKTIKENEAKSLGKLINVICHDFGNPLSVVKGNILMMQRYPERINDRVFSTLTKAIEQMQSIITDTHALQAYKNGRLNVRVKPVNLKDCVEDVILLYSHKAKVKGVYLETDEDSFEGISVLAAANLLKSSVLGNLVSNAIKFTPAEGKISLFARDNGEFIDIVVRDNGIGMSQDLMSKLFDAQANISRAGTNFEQGTGFGMPIVKAFVDSFEGDISVSSTEAAMGAVDAQSGTEFIVSLKRSDLEKDITR